MINFSLPKFNIPEDSEQSHFGVLSLINEISRLQDTNSLIKQLFKDLIYNEIFEFDYCIFSIVDFVRNTISSIEYCETTRYDKKIIDKEWIDDSTYFLSSKDVLVDVLTSKKTCILEGPNITPKIIAELNLNEKIFLKHNHKTLIRFLIPIIHRSKNFNNNQNEDVSLGVIEVGFNLEEHKNNEKLIERFRSNDLQNKLNLYVDNFAQPYYVAYLKEASKEISSSYSSIDNGRINESEYLKKALDRIHKYCNSNLSGLSLKSFNHPSINFFESHHVPPLKRLDVKRKSLIGQKLLDSNESLSREALRNNQVSYSGDVKNYSVYIPILNKINSEISLPLRDENDNSIGIITLSSEKMNYFNKVIRDLLVKSVEYISENYRNIKRRGALKNLSKPLHYISKSDEDIYNPIIILLKEYFNCNYIALWQNTENSFEKVVFELNKFSSTKEIRAVVIKEIIEFKSKKVLLNNSDSPFEHHSVLNIDQSISYYDFCKSNGFSDYIVLKFGDETNVQSFITIHSKSIIHLSSFDRIVLNEVSSKVSVALQSHKLIGSFVDLAAEPESSLQLFAENALSFLNADIVGIFPYDGESAIKLNQGSIAGSLWTENIKSHNLSGNAIISNIIVQDNSADQWFKNKKEYTNFLSTRGIKNSYFSSLNLQSIVALRLSIGNKIVGTLIVEYLEANKVRKNDRSILIFKELATSALILNVNIEKSKIILSDLRKEIKKYDEAVRINQDLARRLSVASYQELVIGLYHDVQNMILENQKSISRIYNYEVLGLIPSKKHKKYSLKNEIIQLKLDIESRVNKIEALLELFNYKLIMDEKIEVDEVIQTVVNYFKKSSSYILERKIMSFRVDPNSDKNVFIYGPKTIFGMIIYNLVKNAIRSFSETERLSYEIDFSFTKSKNNCIIEIKDNGSGISKFVKDRIYDYRFSTFTDPDSKKKGLGIGLYFTKLSLEKEFNGKISFNSIEGRGTSFRLKIPILK